jgi:glyoxylase-like metal-dependent hydrolase (beta-lactamase superfamily II)
MPDATAVLGDFEIALVRAGCYWWDGGAMFGVVPKSLWERKASADERNRIPCGFNCYLIRTRGHLVLIETGGGDKMDERARERMKLPPAAEPLPSVIARNGFDPEAIDIVVNTHLHWDFAPRGEWEHAHERHPRDSVSYIDANYDPLVESGRMTLVTGECEVVPGIRMHRAFGHNRDMMVVTAESGGRTFCFFSDMAPMAAHIQPTWVAAFDLYPMENIDTKTRWFSRAADENWLCAFAHDPKIAFARVERHPKTRFAVAE